MCLMFIPIAFGIIAKCDLAYSFGICLLAAKRLNRQCFLFYTNNMALCEVTASKQFINCKKVFTVQSNAKNCACLRTMTLPCIQYYLHVYYF